jgi:polyphosphate kinase 2 PPK2
LVLDGDTTLTAAYRPRPGLTAGADQGGCAFARRGHDLRLPCPPGLWHRPSGRFLKRVDLPEKNWKFSAADAKERKYWDDYQAAFSDMLTHTATGWAPWYVIPADHKWFAASASPRCSRTP